MEGNDYFRMMQEQDRISQIDALREQGASGEGFLTNEELARYQQLNTPPHTQPLQQLIQQIQQKRNPYRDPYADPRGPTNEDLSREDREFLRRQEHTNSMENYYNNLRNYQVNPQYELDKIL
tara:strand:+ start:3192 stop:3557 length:366 start_codon:yes stop_codon:yes gene_type:complete